MYFETGHHILRLIRDGEYEEATNALLASKRDIFPKSETYYIIGECYRCLGNYDHAKLFLEVAYQLDRDNRRIGYALARVYHLHAHYNDAYRMLLALLRRYCDDMPAKLRLGLVLLHLGRFKAALKTLSALEERLAEGPPFPFPSCPYGFVQPVEESDDERMFGSVLYNAMGVAWQHLGDETKAGRCFWKSIFSKPLGKPFFDPYANMEKIGVPSISLLPLSALSTRAE